MTIKFTCEQVETEHQRNSRIVDRFESTFQIYGGLKCVRKPRINRQRDSGRRTKMKSWNASPATSKGSRDCRGRRCFTLFTRSRTDEETREWQQVVAVLEKNPYEKSATESNSPTVGTISTRRKTNEFHTRPIFCNT